MNIVEKYKEINGQIIILISGLSGSGKTHLGRNICRDFKLTCIDMKKYYKKDFNEKVTLSNGKDVVNYDTDNSVDWDAVNKDVNEKKESGVVVVGTVFPTEKLKI